MLKSKKASALVVLGIFIGAIVGLVLASNFSLTGDVEAQNSATIQPVALGSDEPVDEELKGLETLSKAFSKVAKEVSPSVVTINSEAVVKRRVHPFMDDEFFRRFFNFPDQDREQVLRGLGSGVIINPDGYILTNNHVISEADEIYVTFDNERYDAEIIGTDPYTDLAVIKIDKEDLPAIRLGDSDELDVGEWVLAIGNPFSDVLENTVTAGIVSAKGRTGLAIGGGRRGGIQYQDFIQTDAAINPGNSGGAMVNLRGQLVGINTAIVGQANVGIGFAIPINMARGVMEQLIESGRVSRGYLGVTIQELDDALASSYGLDEPKGVLITGVQEDTPADKVGLKAEDIILSVDGEVVTNVTELQRTIASFAPESKVKLKIWRDNKESTVEVTLGELPTDEEGMASPQASSNAEKLGLEVQNLTDQLAQRLGYEDEEGVLVADVKPTSVADREGLKEGDLIIAVNRQPVRNIGDFNKELSSVEPDDIVLFRIKRGSVSLFAALRMPESD
jgi:serine protease Do